MRDCTQGIDESGCAKHARKRKADETFPQRGHTDIEERLDQLAEGTVPCRESNGFDNENGMSIDEAIEEENAGQMEVLCKVPEIGDVQELPNEAECDYGLNGGAEMIEEPIVDEMQDIEDLRVSQAPETGIIMEESSTVRVDQEVKRRQEAMANSVRGDCRATTRRLGEFEYQVAGKSLHQSHVLHKRGAYVWCGICGNYAAEAPQNLTLECPRKATRRGRNVLARIAKDRSPMANKGWFARVIEPRNEQATWA